MDDSSLTDQKYAEMEYLFQTIEMAKSGQEFKNYRDDGAASLSTLATTPPAEQLLELPLQQDDDLNDNGDAYPYAWNLVRRRLRHHRRLTVSHSGTPPAPPSTPTSSSMTLASSFGSSSSNGGGGGGGGGGNGGGIGNGIGGGSSSSSSSSCVANANAINYNSDCFKFNLLYILDYAPKYKKKLKEQQRTDSELAELFNVITITGSSVDRAAGSHAGRMPKYGASSSAESSLPSNKLTPERGVSSASRNIRKPDNGIKIFKIHRNPKEFFREPDDDSVSAPEYDTEEEETRHRRYRRLKPARRLMLTKRERRMARFELQDQMDAVVDTFDAAMSFNDD